MEPQPVLSGVHDQLDATQRLTLLDDFVQAKRILQQCKDEGVNL